MGTLFEDIRDGLRDGIELVVDKTEEYTKIGKLQVDILGIKRNIEKKFAELGGQVYEAVKESSDADIAKDEKVAALVADLKTLEENLDAKKDEIKSIKDDKDRERKERAENRKKDAENKEKDIDEADVVEETEKETKTEPEK